MLSLLENWPAVARRVGESSSIHLFTDFDGTLVRLKERPEDVEMDAATRLVLLRLARNPKVRVCVLSGRRLDDLRAHVGISGIECRGVHGWETDRRRKLSPPAAHRVAEARKELCTRLNGTPGVRIEDKGVCFALHYRGAATPAIRHARTLLREVLQASGGTLRAVPGACVWEVLPWEIRGKGYTVRKQLHRWAARNVLPIYLGNDDTDETAFEELACGVTARVGRPQRTRAHYFLRNPTEVRRFLEKLEDFLGRGPTPVHYGPPQVPSRAGSLQ